MKITTKGRYGLRAMIELAENQGSQAVSLKEISQRQNISEQYLEQLFVSLRKNGLVRSVRGAYGGYLLNRSPQEIPVGDILKALENSVAPVECLTEESECKMEAECSAHGFWKKLNESLNDVLYNTTLEDLKKN